MAWLRLPQQTQQTICSPIVAETLRAACTARRAIIACLDSSPGSQQATTRLGEESNMSPSWSRIMLLIKLMFSVCWSPSLIILDPIDVDSTEMAYTNEAWQSGPMLWSCPDAICFTLRKTIFGIEPESADVSLELAIRKVRNSCQMPSIGNYDGFDWDRSWTTR